MARRASPKQRRQRKDFISSLLALFAGACIVVVLAWAFIQTTGPPLDPETYCEADGPDALNVVIVDMSEPYNLLQQEGISRKIEAIRDDLGVNHKLVLYLLSEASDQLPKPDFAACNPGKDAHWLYQNQNMKLKQWNKAVGGLGKIIGGIVVDPNGRRNSPIMEMTQIVSVTEFGALESSGSPPMKLIIASDMIQNTAGHSHYNVIPPQFQKFKKSTQFQRVRADLRDVEIDILYIRRENASSIQTDAHLEFWRDYFRDGLGASRFRVSRITG